MENTPTGTYFVGIRFPTSEKSYFFSTTITDLQIGDLVVVDTVSGMEIATVSTPVMDQAHYKNGLALKPLLRKADDVDITNHEINLRNAKRALEIAEREIKALDLPMNLVSAYYTLDGSKVTICYTSTEKRVDFRELLHVLAPQLGARLELFQMMARDKAKYVGGIGICGLPLCCATFLSKFDSINIHMAKNQMLAINNAKLSGPCGKYLCCLSYEDELYTEEKRKFPAFGTVIHTPDGDYVVDAINILSQTVRLAKTDRSDYKTYPLEDVKAMQEGNYVKRTELKEKEEEDLPSFDFSPKANQGRDASYGGMHPSKFDRGQYARVAKDEKQQNNKGQKQEQNNNQNKDKRKQRFHNKNNNLQQQQNNNQQKQQRPQNQQNQNAQQQEGGQNRNKKRHHHHYRHNNRGNNNNQGNNG